MTEAAVDFNAVVPAATARPGRAKSGLRRIAATFRWRDELWGPAFVLRGDKLERRYLERQAVGRDSGIRC